ncbi:molecular chaperone HtpG [Candidatus Spongiihabitans sp.]|uniref:molecular chaperone HtpG n=1 Tax=Candidatus Spongiihabitans sp. TaxID=3101308 RepID=UPI003C6FE4F6
MTEQNKSKPSPKKKNNQKSTQKPTVETHAFQTEVQQLLQLMIHSLYSNKEVFLREIISNASDACDRLRFQSLTDKKLLEDDCMDAGGRATQEAKADDEALGIWINLDANKHSVTIRDNGIGMTHDEVIQDIGTIARSGTKAFLEKMSKDKPGDNNFIGQFGVGFYSCFLVAQEVTLLTRKAGTPAGEGVKWVSDGSGEYTVETVERPERGTEIIISLNKDSKEYAERYRVKSVIAKYSDHISLPIQMLKEAEMDDRMDAGGSATQEAKADKDGKPKKDQPIEWQTINKGSALWSRAKKDISEEDHNLFYKALTYDPEPPALTIHNRVEGKMEYISLFYIPAKAPFDLWDREQRHGIKLYVRRIFIADDAKNLMPNYLRFARGLVDSTDLPLNVSREFLQQNRDIDKIRVASVKKILAEFKKLAANDVDKYNALWKEYGRSIKEGLIEDFENKDTIAKLVRFSSTHKDNEAQTISLDDYITRMPKKQKAIYYVTADSYNAAKSSPHLEIFRKNDIEVLLLSDPVDEWVVGHLTEYEEKSLKSIAKGDLDMDELKGKASKEESKKKSKAMKPLVEKFKSVLENKVKDVRLSDRLVDSPSCLVADEHDLGSNMERILQAIGQDAPSAKPILEINPEHDLVKQIDVDGELADEWAKLLFDQAALAEGASLKDPSDFVKRMNRLLVG